MIPVGMDSGRKSSGNLNSSRRKARNHLAQRCVFAADAAYIIQTYLIKPGNIFFHLPTIC